MSIDLGGPLRAVKPISGRNGMMGFAALRSFPEVTPYRRALRPPEAFIKDHGDDCFASKLALPTDQRTDQLRHERLLRRDELVWTDARSRRVACAARSCANPLRSGWKPRPTRLPHAELKFRVQAATRYACWATRVKFTRCASLNAR